MAVWILEFETGAYETCKHIFGTRKEALEEAKRGHYGKRVYRKRKYLIDKINDKPWYSNHKPMYCIYKVDSYYTGA